MVFSILLYTTYYYVTNLQGDVIAILNTAGTAVVQYTYDAWGNILTTSGTMASTLGEVNPLTYRSYVYDHETGLYYLQSRYYDPELGRFLNADAFASTGQGVLGMNMFAYCGNNPVLNADSSGHAFFPCTFVVNNCGANSSKEEKEADEEINPIHLEELEVLRTKGITFYHGIPVIRVPFLGNAGFSAGIILLGETVCGF